jgi:hypothetical protein
LEGIPWSVNHWDLCPPAHTVDQASQAAILLAAAYLFAINHLKTYFARLEYVTNAHHSFSERVGAHHRAVLLKGADLLSANSHSPSPNIPSRAERFNHS